MDTIEIYLGLGTNEGDRQANIDHALAALTQAGIRILTVSDIIEAAPWGFEAPQDFLNCALMGQVNADVTPTALLDICKTIERDLGRKENIEFDAEGKRVYHSRPIDIDILIYGQERIDTERLTIPHKQMAERDFVMIPLRQIISEEIKSAFPELFRK